MDIYKYRVVSQDDGDDVENTSVAAPPAPEAEVDDNRSNTLIFLCLDGERNLLYVSEQSNNRIRCVLLNESPTLTNGS